MKIIYDYTHATKSNPKVFVQLNGRKPKFLFEKEAGFAIRRASQYSFFYKDKLYDFKSDLIIPKASKAYERAQNK